MSTFHICAISNDSAQQSALLASLESAGFSADNSRFELLDNFKSNTHDPYATINRILATTDRPYLLFCHQDVRLDRGDGYPQLIDRLAELTALAPRWALAGNAGVDAAGVHVLRLTDPYGSFPPIDLPRTVNSLDENFLVIRTDAGVRCSLGLDGFHLYGTDLCLNAAVLGRSAHVIDFHLTHLSAGNATSEAFRQAAERFSAWWNSRLLVGLIRTTTWQDFPLSRFGMVRRQLRRDRVANLVRGHGRIILPTAGLGLLGTTIDLLRLAALGAALAFAAAGKLLGRLPVGSPQPGPT